VGGGFGDAVGVVGAAVLLGDGVGLVVVGDGDDVAVLTTAGLTAGGITTAGLATSGLEATGLVADDAGADVTAVSGAEVSGRLPEAGGWLLEAAW
jgi:hypothetical protein